jgi:hypothetical protein
MLRLLARNADTATPSLIGLPFAAIALLPLSRLGSAAALSGLGFAAMGMFVLFMPLMAIIAGGVTEETDVPMTPRRYAALLALWTVADVLGTQFGG